MENFSGNSEDGQSHPMDFLLSGELKLGIPEAGDIRTGTVVEHRNNVILIDIGAKSEGIISGRELDELSKADLETLAEGNEVSIYIVDPEDAQGNIVLSYAKAAEVRDWQQAKALLENKDTYTGEIVGYNKGGLVVAMGQLRGFIPVSQMSYDRRISRRNQERMLEQLRQIVGEDIQAKVIEVDQSRNRLIMSERAASKEIRAARRAKILDALNEGDIFEGRVVNLTDFGAFVDIGGMEGLVHLSELSWKRVSHPAEVLQIGDSVQVYVLKIFREKERIALSIKRLQTDPWSVIDEIYHVGQLTEATVTKLTKFGAFARLQDEYELEGLIHISELSDERVGHPREVVNANDEVTVRIIRVDPEQRQLGLSVKQVASQKFMEADLAVALSDES